MKVAAVVPHWNRSDLLRTLLPNLAQQRRPFDEIIVVDNGSTDDSVEVAERGGARVIRMGKNAGFAAAVNTGIYGAFGWDWVAILNNDVTLDPGWLEAMEAGIGDAEFACGKILSAADSSLIDATFDEISRGGCAWRCGAGRRDGPVWNEPQTIRMAPMTAALFRRNLFERVGFLDARFESYLEDVDFGLRCARAGFSGAYLPTAVAWHQGSATSGTWHSNTVRLIARNQTLLVAKHFRGHSRWPIVVGQVLWGLVALRHGRGLAYLRGKIEGLRLVNRFRSERNENLGSTIFSSETQILELQRRTGFDWYWRAYFWLSGR